MEVVVEVVVEVIVVEVMGVVVEMSVVVVVVVVVVVKIPSLSVTDPVPGDGVADDELCWSCSNLFLIHNFNKYFLMASLLCVCDWC